MTILEFEEALRLAVERSNRALKAMAPKHKGGEWEEFLAASEAVRVAERDLAAAKGEPYAVPVDIPAWDAGAPMPHLLQNDLQTFLLFYLRDPGLNKPETSDSAAVLVFEHCQCTKMGTPNDEVLRGHPLYGRGLEAYCAMVVHNSSWLKELEAITAVHSAYNPQRWREFKHYILSFHDCTFECVARGFTVETHDKSLSELIAEVCARFR